MTPPPPVITAVTHRPWPLRLRQPFITARGRKEISHNRLITVQLSTGHQGMGEASASLAWPEQTPAVMQRCVAQIAPRLLGATGPQAWARLRKEWAAPWASAPALSAVECALAAAEARAQQIPLWRYLARGLGHDRRRPRTVTTMLTISAWPPTVAEQAARRAARQGFAQLKVKVAGNDPDSDIARLVAVRRGARRATLVVDANQGFSTRGALAFARAMRLLHLPVAAFEQPVAREDLEGMAQLAREATIPIVADESICTVADARRLIARRAAHLFNLKLAKSGLQGTLAILRLAQRHRIALMIGCMAESAVGLTPSVHLACGSGRFRYVDLDSHLLVHNPRGPVGFFTRGSRLAVR